MATRSTIQINITDKEGKKYSETLYHHWDGYHFGVGKELIKLCEDYFSENTDNLWNGLTIPGGYLIEKFPRTYKTEDSNFLGKCGEEFIYIVNCGIEGIEIKAYQYNFDKDNGKDFKEWDSMTIYKAKVKAYETNKYFYIPVLMHLQEIG